MNDSTARASLFVGREDTLELIRNAVARTPTGTGTPLLIQGPAGIGKSALLSEAFAGQNLGCRITWTTNLPDEHQARQWCANTPVALITDDLHHTDAEHLARWRRLIPLTAELPLTLIGACRPLPTRPELNQIRQDLTRHGHPLLNLEPLPDPAVHALLEHLVGAPPDGELQELAAKAAGNPCYIRETIGKPNRATEQIAAHIEELSPATQEALRWAALLGPHFTAAELATVSDRSTTELTEAVHEAQLAGFLITNENHLTFQHPLVEATLRQQIPATTRTALHHQITELLNRPQIPEG